MDMFRPENADGKIVRDLEEINSLQCSLTEPTRIVEESQTPLDVFLTNTPELFEKCGTYDPGLSDHRRSECDEAQQENGPFKSLCTEPCWCHTHAGIDIYARVIDIVSKIHTFFPLARLFIFFGATFFLAHRFPILARLFSLLRDFFFILYPLPDILRAQIPAVVQQANKMAAENPNDLERASILINL